MTLSSLLPLASAAVAPAIGQVIDNVTEGLSFLEVLREQEQAVKPDAAPAATPSTLQDGLAELAERLRERFSQLGIDLTTPLRLKQDGRERVIVAGDHPDRVLVESIFREDETLTNLFREFADAAARQRDEADPGTTKELRLFLSRTDALIEFA